MTDYVKAFQKGLSAAENAVRIRKEIEKIFNELDRQILENTSGTISISIQEREGPSNLKTFIDGKINKYHVICAINTKVAESSEKELAKWTQDRRGYPCKIEWGGSKIICEDGEALANALAELLADPIVGEKLYSLMNLKTVESA